MNPPPVASGEDADELVDQARRQTRSRRELMSSSGFADLSPEVGVLDDEAVLSAMENDPDQTLGLLAEASAATDERLRALARRLAARLFLDVARTEPAERPGIGRITTMPYRPDAGDLDIEASLEPLIEARAGGHAVDPTDLRIRSWARPETAWCLVADRSGSMHGRPLATAALAAAAVSLRATGEYAVLSFAREVIAVKAVWENRSNADVVDRVLALRGHGTTDVAGALVAARQQLERTAARRRVTVLLSDCRATEPGDVEAAARCADELVILAPEGDSDDAAELAGAVGARWTTVSGPSTIVGAIARVLER